MAAILFIAQLPMVNVGSFVYEFYTGVNGGIVVDHQGKFDWNLRLGASLEAGSVTPEEDFAWGVNLLPILVLAYLMIVPWPVREPVSPAAES